MSSRRRTSPDVLSADEVVQTAETIAALQLDDRHDPVVRRTATATRGTTSRRRWRSTSRACMTQAERAYEWLVDMQRPDGSWWNYYLPDGTRRGSQAGHQRVRVRRHRRVAPLAVHLGSRRSSITCGRRSSAPLDWVLGMRKPDGTVLWARTDDDRPWDYALLTGSTSISHSLRCAAQLADVDQRTAARLVWRRAERAARHRRHPAGRVRAEGTVGDGLVLPGPDRRARRRGGEGSPGRRLGRVRHGGQGHPLRQRRAVDHGQRDRRVPRSRTRRSATSRRRPICCEWTRSHRVDDGSYWTGIVYPSMERFPFDETSAYTAAAVILAADAITGASPASSVFVPRD